MAKREKNRPKNKSAPPAARNTVENAEADQLIPLTVRISPALARGLRLAAAERSVDRREPYRQQDILSAALEQWLRNMGYLEPARDGRRSRK